MGKKKHENKAQEIPWYLTVFPFQSVSELWHFNCGIEINSICHTEMWKSVEKPASMDFSKPIPIWPKKSQAFRNSNQNYEGKKGKCMPFQHTLFGTEAKIIILPFNRIPYA